MRRENILGGFSEGSGCFFRAACWGKKTAAPEKANITEMSDVFVQYYPRLKLSNGRLTCGQSVQCCPWLRESESETGTMMEFTWQIV